MNAPTPDRLNHFSLPKRISRLGELAYNLWWAWNPEAQRLFSLIDHGLWDSLNHNTVSFLNKVERANLNAVSDDGAYLEAYDQVMARFDAYMQAENTWWKNQPESQEPFQAAYFSFEFGLHESLPVYAGGLGILAGDTLKEASDMGLPLSAVGFYYPEGYFSQKISEDGWQETRSLELRYADLPVIPLLQDDGTPLMISVTLTGRKVFARILEVHVGRIKLYLLDSSVEVNNLQDRSLTARLYTSDPDVRISQEFLLGIGGVRALRLVGVNPDIWHMNEGHSAFLIIQRLREFMHEGMEFEQAAAKVREGNIFTTHTPVPAGNDEFPLYLIDKYFSVIWDELKLGREKFVDLARNQTSWGETFSMGVLAIRFSSRTNGVSELHGRVSRRMWNHLWPTLRPDDVPIGHITNGVHAPSWMARRMQEILAKYLGEDWHDRIDDPKTWANLDQIPDGEIWAVRRHLKNKLVNYAIEKARTQWMAGGFHPVQVVAGGALLEPYSLTIGFARRFATYKRANLIMRDVDRLIRLVTDAKRPVQIIFAGKAHPADEPGKLIIQQVYRAVKSAENGGRLVFLEDYDMNLARLLVQGVDVWMNTPRRPNEASGTSGMKAAMNGTLNFSVLDGWWREGFNGKNGWAIGTEAEYSNEGMQDAADAESLYDQLENEIIPLYYDNRGVDGTPYEWIARMKESIRTLAPQFSTRRMLSEYLLQSYLPVYKAKS